MVVQSYIHGVPDAVLERVKEELGHSARVMLETCLKSNRKCRLTAGMLPKRVLLRLMPSSAACQLPPHLHVVRVCI